MSSIITAAWLRLRRAGEQRRDSRGASLVEYALLVGLIAIVCLTAVFFLGNETSASFSSTAGSITNAT